ncbi:MAG: ribonuclease HII [Acidobacteria bacterium]|nr:ribonuclease HII [Acidobacteriota bacterium]
MPSQVNSRFERKAHEAGHQRVAGVDEVGRGCLFGPVHAAAVILDPDRPIRGLRDSKQLDAERRETLAARVRERAIAWAVGAADVYEIDHLNILQAARLAMRRAVERLSPAADYLLVDATTVDVPLPQEGIIHGDARSQSIAAASILAKVERDACMTRWHDVFPCYGLDQNKGYSTPDHIRALEMYGPTSLHRFSFEPVRLSCPYEAWLGYPIPRQAELFAMTAGGE